MGAAHVIEDLSLWSLLTLARYALLIAGVCALAVWASRQPDQTASLVDRLTGKRKAGAPDADLCAATITAKPSQPKE